MAQFESKFDYGNRVYLDGDTSITAIVISFQFRTTAVGPAVECSWVHNGEIKTAWLEEWRLELADWMP